MSLINEMVNKFLSWEFPHDLDPDGGIYFDPSGRSLPTGTNLLTATQAKAMIEHIAGERIAVLEAQVAKMPVVVGYVDKHDQQWMCRRDYGHTKTQPIRNTKTDYYNIAVYMDSPQEPIQP